MSQPGAAVLRGFRREVEPGEFTAERAPKREGLRLGTQFDGLLVTGFGGFDRGVEGAEVMGDAFVLDLRVPFVAPAVEADEPVETKGIEPSFRRCDRRVLPLHHVPGTESSAIVAAGGRKSSVVQLLLAKSLKACQNCHFSKLTMRSLGSRLCSLGGSAG